MPETLPWTSREQCFPFRCCTVEVHRVVWFIIYLSRSQGGRDISVLAWRRNRLKRSSWYIKDFSISKLQSWVQTVFVWYWVHDAWNCRADRSDFTERQLPKNKRFKQETLVSQTVENGRALLFKTWEQHGQGLWVWSLSVKGRPWKMNVEILLVIEAKRLWVTQIMFSNWLCRKPFF